MPAAVRGEHASSRERHASSRDRRASCLERHATDAQRMLLLALALSPHGVVISSQGPPHICQGAVPPSRTRGSCPLARAALVVAQPGPRGPHRAPQHGVPAAVRAGPTPTRYPGLSCSWNNWVARGAVDNRVMFVSLWLVVTVAPQGGRRSRARPADPRPGGPPAPSGTHALRRPRRHPRGSTRPHMSVFIQFNLQ